jgi:hypothetical protein
MNTDAWARWSDSTVSTVSVVRYCELGTTSLAKIEDRNESKKKTNKANSLNMTITHL